jgi:hypothetical protein
VAAGNYSRRDEIRARELAGAAYRETRAAAGGLNIHNSEQTFFISRNSPKKLPPFISCRKFALQFFRYATTPVLSNRGEVCVQREKVCDVNSHTTAKFVPFSTCVARKYFTSPVRKHVMSRLFPAEKLNESW